MYYSTLMNEQDNNLKLGRLCFAGVIMGMLSLITFGLVPSIPKMIGQSKKHGKNESNLPLSLGVNGFLSDWNKVANDIVKSLSKQV